MSQYLSQPSLVTASISSENIDRINRKHGHTYPNGNYSNDHT